MCILPIYLRLWYHKMLDYLQNLLMPFSICLDSYTHSMQHFDKHDPFTMLGLWYTSLEHPHVIIFLFYSAFYCTHRTVPTSGMEALVLLLGLWLSIQNYLLLVDFLFSRLQEYQEGRPGSPNRGNRQQVSDVFYLFLKRQEETNYKCQVVFSLLYTKLKGGFS